MAEVLEEKRYIAYIRYHPCCGKPEDDRFRWEVILSSCLPTIDKPIDLKESIRYKAECDYLGGGSWCDDCGLWIEKLEPYSLQRVKELGI